MLYYNSLRETFGGGQGKGGRSGEEGGVQQRSTEISH